MLPDGLELSAFLEREDPRDAFVGRAAASIAGPAAGRDRRLLVAAPPGADPAHAARPQGRDVSRQCADAAAQARGRRCRRHHPRARRAEAARHAAYRHGCDVRSRCFRPHPARVRSAIESRIGDTRISGHGRGDPPCADRPCAGLRARLPRGARRFLPHAACRLCSDRRRQACPSAAPSCRLTAAMLPGLGSGKARADAVGGRTGGRREGARARPGRNSSMTGAERAAASW